MYKQTEEEQTYKVLTEKDNFDEAQAGSPYGSYFMSANHVDVHNLGHERG